MTPPQISSQDLLVAHIAPPKALPPGSVVSAKQSTIPPLFITIVPPFEYIAPPHAGLSIA